MCCFATDAAVAFIIQACRLFIENNRAETTLSCSSSLEALSVYLSCLTAGMTVCAWRLAAVVVT